MYFMLFIREFLSISLFNKKIVVKKTNGTGYVYLLLLFSWNFFVGKREKERK